MEVFFQYGYIYQSIKAHSTICCKRISGVWWWKLGWVFTVAVSGVKEFSLLLKVLNSSAQRQLCDSEFHTEGALMLKDLSDNKDDILDSNSVLCWQSTLPRWSPTVLSHRSWTTPIHYCTARLPPTSTSCKWHRTHWPGWCVNHHVLSAPRSLDNSTGCQWANK